MLALLVKLAAAPLVARQMLHQGLEETMGMVKSCGPPALHAMANEVMSAVHGAVSSIGGAPLPPANAWSASAAAASAQPPASDNFPPGASVTSAWSAAPAAGPDPASAGQLARPLEHEFALALRRATATPAAAVRPLASATPMPPVSSAAFAWSPAKPYARNWTGPGTEPRTQGTATRGMPHNAGRCLSYSPPATCVS